MVLLLDLMDVQNLQYQMELVKMVLFFVQALVRQDILISEEKTSNFFAFFKYFYV